MAQSGEFASAVATGTQRALELIELRAHQGIHPWVGALDVSPIVYREDSSRGQACAEALVLADLLGHELGLPVFLGARLRDRHHKIGADH